MKKILLILVIFVLGSIPVLSAGEWPCSSYSGPADDENDCITRNENECPEEHCIAVGYPAYFNGNCIGYNSCIDLCISGDCYPTPSTCAAINMENGYTNEGCISGYKCCEPSEDEDVPEFNTFGLIAAIVVIVGIVAFWFIKKKKK